MLTLIKIMFYFNIKYTIVFYKMNFKISVGFLRLQSTFLDLFKGFANSLANNLWQNFC